MTIKKITFKILTILSIISIIVIVFLSKNNNKQSSIQTPVPVKFAFSKAIPQSGTTSNIITSSAIEFVFTKPIDRKSLDITIEPFEYFEVDTDYNDTSLFIRPSPEWKTNTDYNMIIKINSKNGEELDKPILYKLRISKMTDSPLTE